MPATCHVPLRPSCARGSLLRVRPLALVVSTTVAIVALLVPPPARADMALPLDIQSALIRRIVSFDRSLSTKAEVRFVVVFDKEPNELVGQIEAALRRAGLSTAGAARVAELESRAGEFDVLYVLPSAVSPKLEGICVRGRVLSVSGYPELAEKGATSVGLGIEQGKPKILINLRRLGREGHSLASTLLGYARVIGGSG